MRLTSPWVPRLGGDPDLPLPARLAAALADDILDGRLSSGDRLPAHRDLAWTLEIGIGTVTAAYAILERRGLTRSVRGRGTFVAAVQARQGPMIDLSVNVPPTLLGARLLARTLTDVARTLDADHFSLYAPPAGHSEHRHLLARWLETLGLAVDPSRVMMTSGAQQALGLAFSLALCSGGPLLTEAMTYPGALTLCHHARRPVHGLPMDAEGLCPAPLAAALSALAEGQRAVYVTPTLHNPTTATMGVDRRQEIVAVCRALKAWIIEDGVYATAPDPAPPLAMLAPERTFHVTSLSKTLSPGLRIGTLVVPPGQESVTEAALRAVPLSPSPLSCAVMADWLAKGVVQTLRDGLHREASRRGALADAALARWSPVRHPNAYHLWIPMPRAQAQSVAAAAAAAGVAVTPPDSVLTDPEATHSGLRLCLGGPSLPDLKEALARLVTVLSGLPEVGP